MHKLRDAPGDSEADLRAHLQRIAGQKKVYVLGLGNVDRADDGAGVLVALELKKRFPDQSFSEHDGVEGTVLDIAEKDEQSIVFFVDAAELRLSPGSTKVVMREHQGDRDNHSSCRCGSHGIHSGSAREGLFRDLHSAFDNQVPGGYLRTGKNGHRQSGVGHGACHESSSR